MQQRFLLQILLLAQHVSGINMSIIRSSRVLYSGCWLEYYTVVAACGVSCCSFSSSWSGVELRVMRPVNQHPAKCLHTNVTQETSLH